MVNEITVISTIILGWLLRELKEDDTGIRESISAD